LSTGRDGRTASSTATEALLDERRRRAVEASLEAEQFQARQIQATTIAGRMGTQAADRERAHGLELATGVDKGALGPGATDPAQEQILRQTAGLPENLAKLVAGSPSPATLAFARFAATRHADRDIVVAGGQYVGHGPNENGEVTVEAPGANRGRLVGRAAVDDLSTAELGGKGVETSGAGMQAGAVEMTREVDGAADRMIERRPTRGRPPVQKALPSPNATPPGTPQLPRTTPAPRLSTGASLNL
jgi:hypothetical protein